MSNFNNFIYKPRNYRSIELWKNVNAELWNNPDWQIHNSIKNIDQLKKIIDLNNHQIIEIENTISELKKEGKEPLRITPYYASLMRKEPLTPQIIQGNSSETIDPIFWQSVPTPANLLFPDTGIEGAMSENSRSFGSVYQRYPNRVALFVAENTSCASYCTHCQRTKSLDTKSVINSTKIDMGLFYIKKNKNINEVLVTGGDALMVNKDLLSSVLSELSRINHIRVIRIATRVPVVLPMAITDSLLEQIKSSANKYTKGIEKYVYFMTHINHYNEITHDFSIAIKKILNHGFVIRNQTVLLNHINDNFYTLAETFRRMFWVGVHPYYLLQCHKEKGLVHFIVPIQVGKILIKQLQGWISGITMPRYAANVEGGGGKVLLMPSGHDTLNLNDQPDNAISESFATVYTWDGRKMYRYEALGRSTEREYEAAIERMNLFFGEKGIFLPKVIIVDDSGNHIRTTNRTKLPIISKRKKAELLNYSLLNNKMPITNPIDIKDKLEFKYKKEKNI